MHEVAHVHEAARQVIAEADAQDRRVLEATLLIGPRVVESVARQAWEDAVRGSRAEQATLHLTPAHDTLQCVDCDARYEGNKLTKCPHCDSDGLIVAPAAEVEVASWE